MKIYKRLCPNGYAAIKRNKLRIGSLYYYRKIEDQNRQDKTEGLPTILMRSPPEGRTVSATEFNQYAKAAGLPFKINNAKLKINFKGRATMRFESEINFLVFCSTFIDGDDLESIKNTDHLGEHLIEITDPQKFKDLVALKLLDCFQDDSIKIKGFFDSISSSMTFVRYQDNEEIDDHGEFLQSLNKTIDLGHAFIKPTSYSPESEYRFIWLPFDNSSGTACPLPFGFKFIDIEVPDIWSVLEDYEIK
jgi:hypothetical protein